MPVLPQFIPIGGGLGTSGLAVAGLAGLAAAWWWLRRILRGAAADVRAALEAALLPMLLCALLGGRLANQLAAPDLRPGDPTTWLAVTGTSLSFTGAVAGAGLGAWWAMAPRPAAVRWAALDALCPAAALTLALGWLGLPVVGRQTQWPWGWPAAPGVLVQPVQIYGCAAFLALAGYLGWQRPRADYTGQNVATFLALAGAVRFVLGFASQATPTVGPWTLTQLADAATVAAGLALAALLGRAAGPREGRAR